MTNVLPTFFSYKYIHCDHFSQVLFRQFSVQRHCRLVAKQCPMISALSIHLERLLSAGTSDMDTIDTKLNELVFVDYCPRFWLNILNYQLESRENQFRAIGLHNKMMLFVLNRSCWHLVRSFAGL